MFRKLKSVVVFLKYLQHLCYQDPLVISDIYFFNNLSQLDPYPFLYVLDLISPALFSNYCNVMILLINLVLTVYLFLLTLWGLL